MSTDPNPGPSSAASRPAGFLAGYQQFAALLPRQPWILDTTQVINELKDVARFRRSLGGVIAPHPNWRAPLLASRHVYDEMYRADAFGHANKFEKAAEQACAEGWPTEPAIFQTLFETRFLKLIRFVETGDLFSDDTVVLSVGSPKDVPTARLAVLLALARPIVLSRDSHLRRPGLAIRDPGVVFYGQARIEMSQVTIYATGHVSVSAARRINAVVNDVSKRVGISSRWIWGVLAAASAAGVYYGMKTPERRAAVADLLQPFVGFGVTVVRDGAEAQQLLHGLSVPYPAVPTLAQRIAYVLTLGPPRHDVASIGRGLSLLGGPAGPPQGTVRETLELFPCFVENDDGWQLGELLPTTAA